MTATEIMTAREQQTWSAETRRGTRSVVHSLTDEECAAILRGSRSEFAARLSDDWRRLSPKQRAWLHILAQEAVDALQPPESAPFDEGREVPGFEGVFALLAHARAAQKRYPKVHLPGVRASLSKDGNSVWVDDGGSAGERRRWGRIDAAGVWHRCTAPQEAIDALLRLAADPAKEAGQAGVATGQCCFCGLPLSTAESRTVGYGPVCADHHGLPWGHVIETPDARRGRLIAEANEIKALLAQGEGVDEEDQS